MVDPLRRRSGRKISQTRKSSHLVSSQLLTCKSKRFRSMSFRMLLFSRTYIFSMLFSCIKLDTNISNWLSRVESSTQTSLVIQSSCSIDYPVSCQKISYREMANNLFNKYKNSVMPHGCHMNATESDIDIDKMCAYLPSQHAMPH